jgi:RNA-directed DNA polymerase
MMNGRGKSDRSTVPRKPPNKAGQPAAEVVEGKDLAEGNSPEGNAFRTQRRGDARSALERVRRAARKDRKQKFTALFHHVYDVERLRAAYLALERDASPGADGETWQHYGENLEGNLVDLADRLKRGAYRAKPVKRAYIPKAEGRQRPIGVPTLEDKIVQRAVVEVLNAIYEEDFLGFSYGFRPGRSQHHALDALAVGLWRGYVNWVLDADIRGFFDSVGHEWLVKFVEHRIADRRIVRLIQKWLAAGVLEDGTWTPSETGTVQGGSISPLLGNLYLHVSPRPSPSGWDDAGDATTPKRCEATSYVTATTSAWPGRCCSACRAASQARGRSSVTRSAGQSAAILSMTSTR